MEWRNGSPYSARLTFALGEDDPRNVTRGAGAVAALLDQGLSSLTVGVHFCEELDEDEQYRAQLAPIIDAICRTQRPALRDLTLTLGDSPDFLCGDDWPFVPPVGYLGDLSALWSRVPNLESLRLLGSEIKLGAIEAPRVRDAEIYCWSPQSTDFLPDLAASAWPALERLVIDLGDDQYTGSAIDGPKMGRLLNQMQLPNLRHLCLRTFFVWVCDFFAQMRRGPLLARLETLALINSTLSNVEARYLIENRSELARARRLVLAGTDGIDVALVPQLKRLYEHSVIAIEEIDIETWRSYFPDLATLSSQINSLATA